MNAFFYPSKRGINFAKIRGFKVTDYIGGVVLFCATAACHGLCLGYVPRQCATISLASATACARFVPRRFVPQFCASAAPPLAALYSKWSAPKKSGV